jgi:RHH-type transcriptional regulator, rel operon repressor / antitoxin RelB
MGMKDTALLQIPLDPEFERGLEALARRTRRGKAALAAEAIAAYLELNAWQVAEIEAALEEADDGDFASDQEVEDTFRKWVR